MVSDLHMFFAGITPLVLWDIQGIQKCVLNVINVPKVRPKRVYSCTKFVVDILHRSVL